MASEARQSQPDMHTNYGGGHALLNFTLREGFRHHGILGLCFWLVRTAVFCRNLRVSSLRRK